MIVYPTPYRGVLRIAFGYVRAIRARCSQVLVTQVLRVDNLPNIDACLILQKNRLPCSSTLDAQRTPPTLLTPECDNVSQAIARLIVCVDIFVFILQV